MTTQILDAPGKADAAFLRDLGAADRRYIWFGIGLVAALLAVGGRWDVPLAAWIAPIFLLRFARLARPLTGLVSVWVVMVGSAAYWGLQSAVPFIPASIAGHLSFGTMFTLPFVLDRLLQKRLGLTGALLLFPAAAAAAEFLAANISPLGTAYGLKAITQATNLPVLQVISLTGPYTIGFLMALLATAANRLWEQPADRGARNGLGLVVALLALVTVGGAVRMALFPITDATVRMAGITPSQDVIRRASVAAGGLPTSKASLAGADRARLRAGYSLVWDELFASTREAAQAGAKIVVWSETAATALPEDKATLLARAARVAQAHNIYLNVAIGTPFAANETHLIAPNGTEVWAYNKNHPVPGMEPVPPVKNPAPVAQTPFGRLSNVICFDADFPALARVNADIMIVPGYDWPEIGAVHTLKMASLRAVENGYSMLRQTFNSQSAAFDPYGRVLASQDTTANGRHMMVVDVPTRASRTLYNLIGDVFAWLCIAAVVGLGAMAILRRQTGAAT